MLSQTQLRIIMIFILNLLLIKIIAVLPEVESFMGTLVDVLEEKEFGASEFGDEAFDKGTIAQYS